MKTLIIGVTGGMGCGKSFICGKFEDMGIPVLYSDAIAGRLLKEDASYKEDIRKCFGDEVFDEKGNIKRGVLSQKIFSDSYNVALINQITLPRMKVIIDKWVEDNSDADYVLIESAIFYENKVENFVDIMLGVHAPMPLRMTRVSNRDFITDDLIQRKIAMQLPQEEKMALCDLTIDGGERPLYELMDEIRKLDKLFVNISKTIKNRIQCLLQSL